MGSNLYSSDTNVRRLFEYFRFALLLRGVQDKTYRHLDKSKRFLLRYKPSGDYKVTTRPGSKTLMFVAFKFNYCLLLTLTILENKTKNYPALVVLTSHLRDLFDTVTYWTNSVEKGENNN